MLPSPLATLVLALAAYRLWRLLALDDILDRPRAWVTGRTSSTAGSSNARLGVTSEAVLSTYTWKRGALARFIDCASCFGFWISLAVYAAWLAWPRPAIYAAVPLAISAIVVIIATKVEP